MPLYVDSSALLKRYVDEPGRVLATRLLESDPSLFTARLTYVEVRRNLARHLSGSNLASMKRVFESDWQQFGVVEVDVTTITIAAELAEMSGVRSLDAIHLAAATRLGRKTARFLTFDVKQAQAARTLSFDVVGV